MYDFDKMEADGYSSEEISKAIGYDYGAMKRDGYSSQDINNAIGEIEQPKPEIEEVDLDMSQLDRKIGLDEEIQAGQKVEPKEALETPVVSPEMAVAFIPQGVKAVGGEVAGSILADIGVESVDDLMSDEFKEKYPTLATIAKVGGGILGGYYGGKIEGTPFPEVDADILKAEKKAQIDDKLKASVDSIDTEDKAILLNAITEAENAGVKLFGTDIDRGTTVAQLQQSMMKNPLSASKIKSTTDEQKANMIEYIDKIKSSISEDFSNVEDVMKLTKENLSAKSAFKDNEITKAYDELAKISSNVSPVGNRIYSNKLNSIKNSIIQGKYTKDPNVSRELEGYINRKIRQLDKSGNEGTFDDIYGFMRNVIENASEAKSGLKKRGYAKMAEDMEILFDEMVESSKYSNEVYDTIFQAKDLYRQRVDLFGYRDTGKGTSSFIPNFLEKIEEAPDKALSMIKKKDDWTRLKDNLDENTLSLIRRAKLEEVLSKSKASGVEDLLSFNRNLKKENKLLMREIFGNDVYNTLLGTAQASEYIGKRLKALENPNILGLEGVRKQLAEGNLFKRLKVVGRIIQEKVGSRLLTKADQKQVEAIKKGLNQSIKSTGMSLDDLLNNMQALDDSMKYDFKISPEEIFKPSRVSPSKATNQRKPKSGAIQSLGQGTQSVGGLDSIPLSTKSKKSILKPKGIFDRL